MGGHPCDVSALNVAIARTFGCIYELAAARLETTSVHLGTNGPARDPERAKEHLVGKRRESLEITRELLMHVQSTSNKIGIRTQVAIPTLGILSTS